MNLRFLRLTVIGLATILIGAACMPQATPVPVDTMATAVARAASALLTQTAAAYSPPPPPATITPTPNPTDTATVTPTSSKPKPTVVLNFTGCLYGPGPTYTLESNISKGKRVEILGLGSVPGWYIIFNPYFHKPCWMRATDLQIDPIRDLSKLPVMTPGP